jgi:hypothetical protein
LEECSEASDIQQTTKRQVKNIDNLPNNKGIKWWREQLSGQKQIAGVIKQINRFNLLEFSPGGLMLTEKQIDNKIKTLTRKFEEMFETVMSQ